MRRALPLFFLLLFATLTASAQLIVPRGSAPEILVPAAGAVAGLNGTNFRSDITIINYRTSDQHVLLRWLPQGSSGVSLAPVALTIPASSGYASEDFVTTVMNQTGLGAIVMTAVTADGSRDPNGRLFATARIWTPQPGSTGTVSQSFPTLATNDIALNDVVAIVGQRRDDRYRTNVGIVNLDGAKAQTFTVRVSTGGTQEQFGVTVQPYSMMQVAATGVPAPTLQINITNNTAGAHSQYVAYGSSVDNVTGDSWSTLGFTPPPAAP